MWAHDKECADETLKDIGYIDQYALGHGGYYAYTENFLCGDSSDALDSDELDLLALDGWRQARRGGQGGSTST